MDTPTIDRLADELAHDLAAAPAWARDEPVGDDIEYIADLYLWAHADHEIEELMVDGGAERAGQETGSMTVYVNLRSRRVDTN